jgi:hypothetical protein
LGPDKANTSNIPNTPKLPEPNGGVGRGGLRGTVPALQTQSPEFKAHSQKKKKKTYGE